MHDTFCMCIDESTIVPRLRLAFFKDFRAVIKTTENWIPLGLSKWMLAAYY